MFLCNIVKDILFPLLQNFCAKGDTSVNYIDTIEPSGSSGMDQSSKELHPEAKNKKSSEIWKEKYFASIVNVDEKCADVKILQSRLIAYHNLLQCIQLEEKMGDAINFNFTSTQ